MKFRHELKYLINAGDAELIRQRLCVVLKSDADVYKRQPLCGALNAARVDGWS